MKTKAKELEKGITLIALIITIIVLLILAGVTLKVVINHNLIGNAQIAVGKYSEEQAKERLNLVLIDYQFAKISGDETASIPNSVENIGGVVLDETDDIYEVEVDGYIFEIDKETEEITSLGEANGTPPTIEETTVNLAENKHSATITVKVTSANGGALTVTIDGKVATDNGDGTYTSEVIIKNGTYRVKAEEEGNKRKGVMNVKVDTIEEIDIYTITLDNQGATTKGTLEIYEGYNVGIYLDDKCMTKITTSTNPITKPEKEGYAFEGYYTEINGAGIQMINADGYITSNFTTTQYTENTTLYSKWTNFEPVVESISVEERGTDFIKVNAKATDANKDNLTYKLYLRTKDGEYSATPTVISSATASGTNVILPVTTDLTSYTVYKYKVEITDGKVTKTSDEFTTGTGCDGTGSNVCNGPFSGPLNCRSVQLCDKGSSNAGIHGSAVDNSCYGVPHAFFTVTDPNTGIKYDEYKLWCEKHKTAFGPSWGPPSNPNPPSDYAHIRSYTCSEHNYEGTTPEHSYGSTIFCDHGYSYSHYYCSVHNYEGTESSHTYTGSVACRHSKYSRHNCCSHDKTSLHFPN